MWAARYWTPTYWTGYYWNHESLTAALGRVRMVSSRTWIATAVELATANPILASGELGVEVNTDMGKLGDGVRAWNDLPYLAALPPGPSTATRWEPLSLGGLGLEELVFDGHGNLVMVRVPL